MDLLGFWVWFDQGHMYKAKHTNNNNHNVCFRDVDLEFMIRSIVPCGDAMHNLKK